jgi:hypothetical protein
VKSEDIEIASDTSQVLRVESNMVVVMLKAGGGNRR